jgi:hypothetical protein
VQGAWAPEALNAMDRIVFRDLYPTALCPNSAIKRVYV